MRIILVEDDASICQELKILLENALYDVHVIKEFKNAAMRIIEQHADLVLLDISLPEESGFDICTKVRKSSDIPIIFLTSNTSSMSELTGMIKGGDDYIAKPFDSAILLARITAVLKRTKRQDNGQMQLECRGVLLDLEKSCVLYENKQIDLTKNELKILHCLFLKAGKIVSRMELVEYLWDNQVFIDDNTLSVHMTRVRGKLKEIGVREFIETRRGQGYRIENRGSDGL